MKLYRLLCCTALAIGFNCAIAADFPVMHPNEIIAKYGKADRVISSEYETPRPFIVTKLVEYKKENVRFIFVPKGKVSAPPPYAIWQLIGTQDIKTGSAITSEEAEQRLAKRKK